MHDERQQWTVQWTADGGQRAADSGQRKQASDPVLLAAVEDASDSQQ